MAHAAVMKVIFMEVMRKVEVLVLRVAALLVLKKRMDIVILVMLAPFRLKGATAKSAFQEPFLWQEAAIVQRALPDQSPHCQVLLCAVHVLWVSMKRTTSFATSVRLVLCLPATHVPNVSQVFMRQSQLVPHVSNVQQLLSHVRRPAQDAAHVLLVRFQLQAVQFVASVMPVGMLQVARACHAQQALSQQMPAQDAAHVLLVRFQPQAVQFVASVMPVGMLQVARACHAQQALSQQMLAQDAAHVLLVRFQPQAVQPVSSVLQVDFPLKASHVRPVPVEPLLLLAAALAKVARWVMYPAQTVLLAPAVRTSWSGLARMG